LFGKERGLRGQTDVWADGRAAQTDGQAKIAQSAERDFGFLT